VNDSELNDLLRLAGVPERKAEGWKESTSETMRRLRISLADGEKAQARGATKSRPRRWRSIVIWSAGCATALVFIGFILGNWHAGRRDRSHEIAAARKLFAELSAMFPDQLEAVMLDGSTPRIALADKPWPGSGAPLFVRICGPRGCQRIITFSGRRVQVNGENCEVLADARGGIIVTGDTFVWSSSDAGTHAGRYRIEAAPLAQAL
jgi:hypothetical protein